MRGLSHGNGDIFITDINNTLSSHGIEGDIVVKRFVTGKMNREPDGAPVLFSIIVGPELNDKNIHDIKRIGTFHVVVEKMKRSSNIQCHRCQRFQHTAGQCHFKYRCVQCISVHDPGMCPRKSNKNLPLGCVNCYGANLPNYVGHSANNLQECQFYINKINLSSTVGKSQQPYSKRCHTHS